MPPTGRVFLAFHHAWGRTAQALEAGLAENWRSGPGQPGERARGQCSRSYLNES
jgi:hypothetical protein